MENLPDSLISHTRKNPGEETEEVFAGEEILGEIGVESPEETHEAEHKTVANPTMENLNGFFHPCSR